MVTASDLRSTGRRFDSQPLHYQVATLGKLFTHMCLCHQAVQFGTGQRAVMLCGREGNCRPGVALAKVAMRVTDFSGLSTYGLKGYMRGR